MNQTVKGSEDSSEAAPAQPYVVLARKYRPETFDDLIGQGAMVQTLRNAFGSDRIAQAYMLTGVRGVGKTTTARILARALNYEHADSGDRPAIDMPVHGRHCDEIIQSRHPDVLEMDAASNTGIDNIREIIESARYKPLVARYKVFIIDEVHMLSKGAFNALLKTLEEPPTHVKFIFATTEVRKVPVTVLSRCQRFDLRRVDVPTLSAHFERIATAEGASAEPDALTLISRAAEGSVRDGLSILDQAIAMGSGAVSLETVRAMLGLADRGRIFDLIETVLSGQAGAALTAFDALHGDGAEPIQLLADLAETIHAATRIKVAGVDAASEALSGEERRRASELAERLSIPLMARAWQMLLKGLEETARAPDPRAAAEMVLIRLAHTADLPAPDELIRRLAGIDTSAASPPSHTNEPPATAPVGAPPWDAGSAPDNAPTAVSIASARDSRANQARAVQPSPEHSPQPGSAPDELNPATFDALVALVGEHRDAMLRLHLEDNVSLVHFEPGHIEISLMPGAPTGLAGDLSEKLTKWTGRRWIVSVSSTKGAPPLGEVRRAKEAAEIDELKAHPAVKALLDAFPDADIRSVRPISPDARSAETKKR